MTANRKPKTPTAAPAPAAQTEPTPEVTTTYLRGLDDYVTVKSPRNIREQTILDGIRKQLERRHREIDVFITEKVAEGFSKSDIHELFSVEVALMPIVEERNGRPRVRWPFVFVERDAS